MNNLIDMIQERFADCLSEVEVCQLYAEIRIEVENQMEHMLEYLKEKDDEV